MLKVCVHPSRHCNNECGPAWKTRRARPEGPICCALPLGKGATRTVATKHNSCTLQATLSAQGVIQRLPNLPIIALVMFAFMQVATHSPHQRLCHRFLASLGILTVAIHSGFFLAGHTEFWQPMSLLLLAATLILSLAQLKTLPLAGQGPQTQNQRS
ncbi:DUF6713 family protein [Alcanivorax sp. HI0083]|uniref:DUF6713 family protein n=2 Tax=Alcanivorax TaxID=59753 RepID=UPI0035183DAB